MWEIAELFLAPILEKMSTRFLKTTNQTQILKDKGFSMQEAKSIKVPSRAKMVTQYLAHTESSQENYQFRDPLEILRRNYPNMMATRKY